MDNAEWLVLEDEQKRQLLAELNKKLYAQDPATWAAERLGVFLWSKQREIMEALTHHSRIAVPSCHSAGKSFTAAEAAAWWLDTHPPGTAFVLTTAPTAPQVKAILWKEINRVHKKGNLPGRCNLTEWYIDGELVAMGRKPNEYDDAAFQGIHATYVLVILDESGGIPDSLLEAAESIASNEFGVILATGNPDNPNSMFRKICENGKWKVIKISAFDTPNFTGEEVPDELKSLLISPRWVEERKADWGEDSAVYRAKVLGEFPDDAKDGVVPYSWVKAAMLDRPAEGQKFMGVDVGAGGDRTVCTVRQGLRVIDQLVQRSDDAMGTVGEIVRFANDNGVEFISIDVIGIGYGVAGRLKELYAEGILRAVVNGVNVAERAHDPERFVNRRTEIWWEIGRELSETQGWDLTGVGDECIAELCAPTWALDSSGRIRVEKKDDTIKRIGKSPDLADSLLLAFIHPFVEMGTSIEHQSAAMLPGVKRR